MQINREYLGITNYIQKNSQKSKSVEFVDNAIFLKFKLNIKLETQKGIEYQAHTYSLADIGYKGKDFNDLTQDEAKTLVNKNGFFGIDKTAKRVAQFVISGAGGREDFLKAGREGILQGLKDAEEAWGGKLPDISYKSINKALEIVDKKMVELGFLALDESA